MSKFIEKGLNAKKQVKIEMSNEEYLASAPEGFKDSNNYLKEQNEKNKKAAVEEALKIFKKDKTAKAVVARIPFGNSKLDAVELTIKRETAKTPMNPDGNPTVAQKPKSSLMGSNTHLAEMKKLLKEQLK